MSSLIIWNYFLRFSSFTLHYYIELSRCDDMCGRCAVHEKLKIHTEFGRKTRSEEGAWEV